MGRARRRLRQHEGFTLVELVVATVLMLVVLAGIYTIWFGLQRTYSFTEDDMGAQQQARTALAEMVEAIRTGRQPDNPPDVSLDLAIVSADANELICWTDVDRDPAHTLELVRYRVDTSTRTLYRDDFGTPEEIYADHWADHDWFGSSDSVRLVGNWLSNTSEKPLFTYVDANGSTLPTPVSDPTKIREVAIDLLIDIDTERAPISHELRSVVQPRNLRQ